MWQALAFLFFIIFVFIAMVFGYSMFKAWKTKESKLML